MHEDAIVQVTADFEAHMQLRGPQFHSNYAAGNARRRSAMSEPLGSLNLSVAFAARVQLVELPL